MAKVLHIGGIVAGYIACVATIIVGIINKTPNVPGWKFIMMGIALAICATIAVIDGARAFPQIGIWKIGAKYEGIGDLAFLIIFVILVVVGLIAVFA